MSGIHSDIARLVTQRLLIEELTRKRRSDDAERFVEVFRRSTIDPNPHQIEAAMFALRRLPAGGAMLCDEVGLGKTIEAGLVISQLRAQGKVHILIIVPLALARQWQVEMQDLFSLNSTIVSAETLGQSTARGIHIVGREFASSTKGRAWLESKSPWDLIVVDEAHEMFSTIHTRFSKTNGAYLENLSRGGARRAAQVRELMKGSPVLLLTATPLQNNLYELWGLVQYVDPDQRILGRLDEFCTIFATGEGGRAVVPEMAETLRRRLSLVLKRTLRRQAQPFMKQPFRARHVHTANFNAASQETELYRSISIWLGKEVLAAYRKGRQLMAIQLRRRMASSIEALVSALSSVKARMLKIRQTGVYPMAEKADLDDEDLSDESDPIPVDMRLLEEDLAEVQRLEALARSIMTAGSSAKKEKLLDIIKQVESRSLEGVVSDKVVIFTESLRTLESLVEYLEANGFKDQVTTFSGVNDSAAAQRALAVWQSEVGRFQRGTVDPSAVIRGALIHEFKTRTKIFIATEAGAKGLNLQFCNCLINYDLPWNPQRIEQRIGRVHRYGQKHDVLIVNFINLSNEAEQRVYELLAQKLDVFQTTLGASDTIISTPEIALNLETRINEMLNQCRTQAEIRDAFDKLNLEIDEAERQLRDEKLAASRNLIADFDNSVKAKLGKLEGEIAPALSRADDTLLQLIRTSAGEVELLGEEGPRTRLRWNGTLYHIGPPAAPDDHLGEPLHAEHPEVLSLMETCIATTDGQLFAPTAEEMDTAEILGGEYYRVRLSGLEEEERIMIVGSCDLPQFKSNCVDSLETGLAMLKREAEEHQREYIDRLLAQIDSRRDDLRRCNDSRLADLEKKLDAAQKARKSATSLDAASKAQIQQKKLRTEIDNLRTESQQDMTTRLHELDEEERKVRKMQFVEVTPTLLFTVKQPSNAGRTPA